MTLPMAVAVMVPSSSTLKLATMLSRRKSPTGSFLATAYHVPSYWKDSGRLLKMQAQKHLSLKNSWLTLVLLKSCWTATLLTRQSWAQHVARAHTAIQSLNILLLCWRKISRTSHEKTDKCNTSSNVSWSAYLIHSIQSCTADAGFPARWLI